MKRVENTSVEFSCKKNEIVTIGITENNTNLLVSHAPTIPTITMTGKTLTIQLGTSSQSVTLSFGFSSTGGSYDLVLNGNKDDDSFSRNISQPNAKKNDSRIYVFHVS